MKQNYLIQTTIAATVLFATGHAYSAVTGLSDGDFEVATIADGGSIRNIADGPWWDFEGSGFTDFLYHNSAMAPTNVVGFGGNTGHIYQNIGTYSVGEDLLNIVGDAFKHNSAEFGSVTFEVYAGNFTPGDGPANDVAANATFLSSGTIVGTDIGITTASTHQGPAAFSLTLDLLGATAGEQLWLRISKNEVGLAYLDNLVVTGQVPEPSAALLGSLGALALLRRRRNA